LRSVKSGVRFLPDDEEWRSIDVLDAPGEEAPCLMVNSRHDLAHILDVVDCIKIGRENAIWLQDGSGFGCGFRLINRLADSLLREMNGQLTDICPLGLPRGQDLVFFHRLSQALGQGSRSSRRLWIRDCYKVVPIGHNIMRSHDRYQFLWGDHPGLGRFNEGQGARRLRSRLFNRPERIHG